MRRNIPTRLILSSIPLLSASALLAADWPQWRGPNRDAKVTDFKVPQTWPKQLTQKWRITVGEGVATPALVGDKLFVFSRQNNNEIIRCLDANSSKELWQDKYESLGATGPASGFSGPRSSPTVSNGKVITLGVRGVLSCYDAATGNKIWRKDEFQAWPGFFVSSSPMVVDGVCIAQLGGRNNGALVAYDLNSGEQKWKLAGDSPAYASLALMTINGTKLIIAETDKRLLAVNAADGKLAWESPATSRYNASTPVVDGPTIILAGDRGIRAIKLEKQGDAITGKELWNSPEKTVQFNTPVVKDGLIYGLSQSGELFALNAQTGKAAWAAPLTPPAQPAAASAVGDFIPLAQAQDQPPQRRGGPGGPGGQGGPGGGRRGGGGGMGRGGAGYGSILDAGSVMLVLTPASDLIAFQPSDAKFIEVARIKVAPSQTHAHPVVSGNRVYIKDQDSLTLWTIE